MKSKFFFILIPILFSLKSKSQSFIYNRDTTICINQPVRLNAYFDTSFTTLGLDSIDDVYSKAINIGFPFTFYGKTYTQCTLSSNAYISFDTSYFTPPGAITPNFSPFTISNAIPSNSNPLNSIFGVWHDVDPSVAPYGIRTYLRTGVAPFRKFVFTFCNVPMFSQPCNLLTFTGQIILFEDSNKIEIHVGNKVSCPTWNSGYAILGVQDDQGTKASFPAGYNFPAVWAATNQSWRFSWDSITGNYINYPISYNPIPVNIGGTWIANGAIVSTDSSFIAVPNTSTTYYVNTLGCAGNSFDSVKITVINTLATNTVTNPNCGNNSGGSIISNINSQTWPISFSWFNVTNSTNLGNISLTNSNHIDTLKNLPPGIYSYQVTNSLGCSIFDTFSLTSSNFPVVNFSNQNSICFGSSTGMIFCNFVDTSLTYQINCKNSLGNIIYSNLSNKDDTIKNLKAGTYFISISLGANCNIIDTIVINSDNFTVSINSTNWYCALNKMPFSINSSVPITYASWNWSDNSNNTIANSTNHTFTNSGNYNITLIAINQDGCIDTTNKVVSIINNIKADFTISNSKVCAGEEFSVVSIKNQFPIQWQFQFDDNTTLNNYNGNHIYINEGIHQIILKVTDSLCGSDSITKRIEILPKPILSLGNDLFNCIGTTIKISPFKSAKSYLWSDGSTTPQLSYLIQNSSSTVWLEINDTYGCINRDTVIITADQCSAVFPNAFTPNGDGIDDYFKILSRNVIHYSLAIYNRWGNKIYYYNGADTNLGWDGKYNNTMQALDTYTYFSVITFTSGEQINLKGNVTLIR
jgi:gliding motility-associated-like protein